MLVSGTSVIEGEACFVALVIGEDTCQNQQMLASEQLVEKENPPLIDKIESVNETMRSSSIFAAGFTLLMMILRIIFEMTNSVPCGCESLLNCEQVEECEKLDLKKGNRIWVKIYEAISISLLILFCPMLS